MQSLTALLLMDALDVKKKKDTDAFLSHLERKKKKNKCDLTDMHKGGPGSGPHPGNSSKGTKAAEKEPKGTYYHTPEAHKAFAQAHRDHAAKLKAAGDKEGAKAHMKAAQAHETASRKHDIGTGEAAARQIHAQNSSYNANRGKMPGKF